MLGQAGTTLVSLHAGGLRKGLYVHSCGGRIRATWYGEEQLASIQCERCRAVIKWDKDSHVIELNGDPLDYGQGGLLIMN